MSTNRAPKPPHKDFVFDPHDHKVHEESRLCGKPARRRFLQLAAGGLMTWIARTGSELSFPQPVFAQSALSPDLALGELIAGNKRFIKTPSKSRNPLPQCSPVPTPVFQ
jgi:hypothetical protein